MVDGRLGVLSVPADSGLNHVVVGRQLALDLGVKVGEALTILVSRDTSGDDVFSGGGGRPGEFTVLVGGIFEAGFGEFDSKVIYAGLPVAQSMFDMGGAINALEVKTVDPLTTRSVITEIERLLTR